MSDFELSDEANNRGKQIVNSGLALLIVRLWIARMLSKNTDWTFAQALRWTSIATWAVYLAGRHWNTGLIASETHMNLVKQFGEDMKAAKEAHEAKTKTV